MSRLAHAAIGTSGMEAGKEELSAKAQLEIRDARSIQSQTGCTWSEALRIAAGKAHPVEKFAANTWRNP
jgi:hypothetical protein